MRKWIEMPLVGMDTETTGLSVVEDRIFELGLVTFQGDQVVDSFCEMMDPTRPLSDVSREKTGVREEDLRGKPTFAAHAHEIVRRMTDTVIVGYNILGFDLPMLQAELRRVGLELPRCHAVDVLIFARQLVKSGRHNLGEMARQLGIAMDTAHRATADAEATVRLLHALAPQVPEDLDELVRLQGQWREEQRAKRALWRQRPGAEPGAGDGLLRQEVAPSASMVDAEGRVSLGPSYVYGNENDPLRAFLIAYCNSAAAGQPRT